MPTLIAGRYEILAEIGRGGMGLVARAYDHRLDTEVAIKVLRPDLAKDSGDKDSLIKEARVLARLTHPSIVRLFDLAETEVGLMLVLEFVKGPNLAKVMESRGKLTIAEFLHVARQICAGLSAAHAEGVIHRDLKPPNLLVAPSRPEATGEEFLLHSQIKITDFGISKLLASKVQAQADVATSMPAGTPIFMAPEQFAGRPCTPATDIYALGVIAYLALAGRPPFIAESIREIAYQHFRATAEPIAEIPATVNAVIQRALAKAPIDRFASAPEFLHALEHACLPPAPAPPPVQPLVQPPILEPDALDKAAAWFGRNWWKFALGLVAVAALFLYSLTRRGPDGVTPLTEPAKGPQLGQIVSLPEDLDVVPNATTLPPPAVPAQPAPAHAGPHKAPRAMWTAMLNNSDDFHSSAFVDGVGPDGTVYIRNEGSKSLWAVDRSGTMKWGYRAPEPANLARLNVHVPGWPNDSHVDFRDPGRVWLTNCDNDCLGIVFNATGSGGVFNQVPPALRTQPLSTGPAFQEDDPQNGHWPNNRPTLRYNSRMGSVLLTSGERWSVPLNSRPVQAIEAGGKLYILTKNNTIYAIAAGRIEWTYQSAQDVHALHPQLNGALLLLSGKDHQIIQSIMSGAKAWEFTAQGWLREIGPVDSSGALYLVSNGGNNLALYGIESDGKPLWTIRWAGVTSSAESLRLDESGRLFLSHGRFEMSGKARKGVVCFSE